MSSVFLLDIKTALKPYFSSCPGVLYMICTKNFSKKNQKNFSTFSFLLYRQKQVAFFDKKAGKQETKKILPGKKLEGKKYFIYYNPTRLIGFKGISLNLYQAVPGCKTEFGLF